MGRPPLDPLDASAARVAALDALARRDLASEELRRKLLEKGYDIAVVAQVLEALRAEKLVDDRRYIENFVAYHASRGQGPIRIQMQLRRKGLDEALVEGCLAAYPEWLPRLKEAQRKKFGARQPDSYIEKQRQSRFLNYRGFTSAQIRTALGFDIDIESDT